jgi:hypothetical protein
MRFICTIFFVVGLSSCSSIHRDPNRSDEDGKSAAFKAGEVAHGLSKEVGKAANAAGREIGRDAHELRDGWKEAQQEDRRRKETKGR